MVPIPVYYPYAATWGYHPMYNPYTGAYGYGAAAYGPYGGQAHWGASYNPYTGTYARGATASGPWGSTAAAQAYNPYTGAYAQTHQSSNAYGSWGNSVYSKNGTTTYTQHQTTANGTEATAYNNKGGEAAATSTKYGNSAAAKSSNGDMYAAHDGNVYKNTGSGWQSYNNGSWNNVQKPTQQSAEAAHPQATTDYNNAKSVGRMGRCQPGSPEPCSGRRVNPALRSGAALGLGRQRRMGQPQRRRWMGESRRFRWMGRRWRPLGWRWWRWFRSWGRRLPALMQREAIHELVLKAGTAQSCR